jgi:hypothetical protein
VIGRPDAFFIRASMTQRLGIRPAYHYELQLRHARICMKRCVATSKPLMPTDVAAVSIAAF